MAGKRKENEAGSSNDLRADALRVLGVFKVATADQIQRLSSPHLTYRHTTKPTPAKRKEARTACHRAAVNDLRRHGMALDGGRTRGGEETRLLTKDGLAAAAIDLDRDLDAGEPTEAVAAAQARRRRTRRDRHPRPLRHRGRAPGERHLEEPRDQQRPRRRRPDRPGGRCAAAVHRGRQLHRESRLHRPEVRQVRPVLPAAGEGHRRHREAAVAHPLVRARL